MKRILTGDRPTSDSFHLGNYIGSLKNRVKLQDEYDTFVFIADLHALTTHFDKAEDLNKNIKGLMLGYLSVGLDPKKVTFCLQSQLPETTELMYILATLTQRAVLERQPALKEKLDQGAQDTLALYSYPVLMAADILLYKPTHVPVGHDQIQHLELTNTIVRKFNHKFGQTFNEVKIYAQKPLRIMSLSEPERKMSKSEPGSFINMFDEPEEIHKKLAKAVTATDAPAGQMPKGVANLFELLTHFGSPADHERLMKEYQGGTIKYSELKQVLGDAIANYFAPMRVKRAELEKNPDQIIKIFTAGAKKAQIVAQATLAEVKQKIGLI